MNQPFFSIIIPTYNPGSFLTTLLASISNNNCTDQIEIILSDDCSTEPFDDIIESFSNLNIRKIVNEKHYGFPRTGRQNGADVAQGKWITFSDQDDYYIEHSFDKIIKFIADNPEVKNYIATDLICEDADTKQRKIYSAGKAWTHGKFYEKTFWDDYNLFYDEVDYCEDIDLSNRVGCIMIANDLDGYFFPESVYVWNRRKDSLSTMQYFIDSFPDYIRGTLGVVLEYFKQYKDNSDMYYKFGTRFISTFYHMYFYLQSAVFFHKPKERMKVIMETMPIFDEFKEEAKLTTQDIINLTYNELLPLYNETRDDDYNQIPFIEQITFRDWMNTFFD